MNKIIPAILPLDFADLLGHLAAIKQAAPLVQIDVCDGVFVPRKTWPFIDNTDEWQKITAGQDGLPDWQSFDFEIDLMVQDQLTEAKKWIEAGAKRIIFHWEAGQIMEAITAIKKDYFYDHNNDVFELGVAINLDSAISELDQIVAEVNFVQIMGIAQIGYQGQAFDERTFNKITELRQKFPQLKIQIDGGVSSQNAVKLIKAGADSLVIGSAIFQSELEPKDALSALNILITQD